MAVKISGLPELTILNGTELIPLVSGNITKQVEYSTIKQNILNAVPPAESPSWSNISGKPFTTIGDGLTVSDGVLFASGLDFTALSNMIVQGENMSIITDSNAKTITFNATGGINFDALAVAMTTGTQSGITVTADSENNKFNFEVTTIPTIAIDAEGYWIVDGDRGENPTKAQGEKGSDGISPTAVVSDTESGAVVTITDKNGTTAVEIFDGADGVSPTVSVAQTETGCTITVTDGSGTTTADLTNGVDGISPHIDETTKHWFVGENDTGVIAEGVTTISTTSLTYIGSLVTDNWIGDTAPYTQTINITGITADNSPIIDLIVSDDIALGKEEMTQWSYITKATTGENSIAFSCYEKKPSIALNFKVKVV